MTTVLVFSTGQTDVQLLKDGKRHEFAKPQCSALHRELQSREGQWRVVDAPPSKGPKPEEKLPSEGEVLLCTPKLDAVLRYFEGSRPDRLLVLETTRSEEKDDPWFTGAVLERRAKSHGVPEVLRRSYLGPNEEKLEDRDKPEDAIVRRVVVERIEEAIRNALNGADRVVVAASGGMPEVKSLVREFCRLHVAPNTQVEFVEVDHGAQRGEPDRAVVRERFDPIEAVRARRHALALIENGNFIGAWAVAEPIHQQRPDQRSWTRIAKWLYCFASSLPIPEDCDIRILKHGRMAVRAALRVELALRAGDLPRAVQSTVAFLESAIRDHLAEYDFSKDGFSGELKKGLTRADELHGELKERYQNIGGRYAIRDFQKSGAAAWVAHLGIDGLNRLNANMGDVRDLRNDVAHNEPTPELMRDARRRMIQAKLWSEYEPSTFLSQQLVQDVLRELDVGSPETLCESLLSEVRRRLLRPGESA